MKNLVLVVSAGLVACAEGGEVSSPVESTPRAQRTPDEPWFEEVAAERGLQFVHRTGHDGSRYLMPEIVSGGAALFDADGDGDLDAYLVQGGGVLVPEAERPPNRLFRNDGAGSFEDATEGSGTDDRRYGMGTAVGDVDSDGDLDLFVTNLGPNGQFENLGDGRFRDVAAASGTDDERWGASATFFDADLDGALDLFVVNYIDWYVTAELDCRDMMGLPNWCAPVNYEAPPRHLFLRGLGDGRFEDRSEESGVAAERGTGLGVVAADFDDDGLPDVFVANDGMPDFLWRNLGDARFENVAHRVGCALDHEGVAKAGMGVTVADVDDDGDLDLLVCNRNRESDSYFENEGGRFRDRASAAGLRILSRSFTRFGMGWLDIDHDGRLDLYQANGRVGRQSVLFADDPLAEPNLLLTRGEDGRFVEVLPRGGTREPVIGASRAAAFGDVDGDGDVDVLVVEKDAPARLLLNRVGERGDWIGVRALGASGSDAIGATVLVEHGGRVRRRDVRSGYSYLAANELVVRFGLGPGVERVSVRVRWPDGTLEDFGSLASGQVHALRR